MRNVFLFLLLINVLTARFNAQVDLVKPFEDCKIKGSITIYDFKNEKWIFSDSMDSNRPTLPASTFKIINTLIALETGAVSNAEEVIKWPGSTDTLKYGFRPDIYHDMSMKEAFKLSAGWAYVEVAKKIGKERYKKYLKMSRYGNGDLSVNDDDFWNFGNFAISPVNQIEIVRGVYEESLPFKKSSFKALKDMMIDTKTEEYTIRAKTGWTRDKGKDTGWWVGYVERPNNVYFFATRLIKDRKDLNHNFGKCRKEITLKILRELNIL
ncbi:penicillin-binding transpeptidase domain-containing protein [Chryseobacterium jejuense]|uniref:beta-lactamase n=1 Tax=Chryseobacterium jejuense TaxID=445960 RepID=A0A2X2VFY1_CHRJE|nr:penicillin-binding transpeptidase domain-containing protein [Chryseobacterium jejuense]SDJ15200.1 beta-lactamase class D [Chryseobacterium jejuense]SQB28056.1 Beta-lactamase OXA-2 precursor [Chryseobacterium jejuense]